MGVFQAIKVEMDITYVNLRFISLSPYFVRTRICFISFIFFTCISSMFPILAHFHVIFVMLLLRLCGNLWFMYEIWKFVIGDWIECMLWNIVLYMYRKHIGLKMNMRLGFGYAGMVQTWHSLSWIDKHEVWDLPRRHESRPREI